MSENSSPSHKITLGILLAIVIYAVVEFIISAWFHARVIGDFWPADKSTVGPNIVASIVTYIFVALVLSMLYPPFRKALGRVIKGHKKDLTDHTEMVVTEIHVKLDANHAEAMKKADDHHAEHLAAINATKNSVTFASGQLVKATLTPVKKVTAKKAAVKTTPVKKTTAKKAAKVVATAKKASKR